MDVIRRMALIVGFVLSLTIGLGCSDGGNDAGTGGAAGADAARALDPVPPFDLPRLGGGQVSSDDLAGRIVIVDFWATWCPPCEFQVPELNAFWDAHRDEPDVALFGVSVDTVGASDVAIWAAEMDVRYPILLEGEPLARAVGALGFPTLLVITPDGLIEEQHVGLIERASLEEALARLRAAAAAGAEAVERPES